MPWEAGAAARSRSLCSRGLRSLRVSFFLPLPLRGAHPAIPDPATTTTFMQMASMLEGGGKTPILPPQQLQDMGFKLCAYPLSLLGVSVRAMEVALEGLKRGQVPASPAMPSFQVRARGRTGVCSVRVPTVRGRRVGRGVLGGLQLPPDELEGRPGRLRRQPGVWRCCDQGIYSRERASAGLFSSQIGEAPAHPAM